MFGSSRNGANAYAKVGLETGVVAASPHKLIVMLFEGAIAALNTAETHMHAHQFEQKGRAILKAIHILEDGLRASLDMKAGGGIAANLDALYAYIVQRLLHANLHNDTEVLRQALALLSDLKTSWEAIAPAAAAAPVAPARPPGFDSLAPRTSNYVSA
jgi:flagellar protein FliS